MARILLTPEGKAVLASEKYSPVSPVEFPAPQGNFTPMQQPQSSSSGTTHLNGSSSSMSQGELPPEKSSSTATQTPPPVEKQAAPAPAPKKNSVAPASGSTDTAPAVQESFRFTGGDLTEEAPVEEDPEKKAERAGLAMGTALSTVGAPRQQKYQTVFNWLTRRDPTVSPWTDFVLHGPRTSRAVSNNGDMQAAQFEQQVLKNQAQNPNANANMNYAQVRLRQQYQQQWDKLLSDWNHGYYSGNEQTEQEFYDEAERLMSAMEAAGMDTSLLRKPSINAGGFSQGYNKNLADPFNTLTNLDETMGMIWNKAKNNPDWLKTPEATTLFDKLGEKAVLDIAQSKGAIADAEKVRIQVEMMDPTIRKAYDNIMFKFFRDNKGLAALANQYQLTASERQTVNSVINDLSADTANVDKQNRKGDPEWNARIRRRFMKGTPEHLETVHAIAHIFNAMRREGDDIPTDLNVMFNAFKNGIDQFNEYVLRDAPVNMGLIWNIANRSRNEALNKYNTWAERNGKRFGWGYKSKFNAPDNFGDQLEAYQQTPDFQSSNPEIYRWKGGVTASPYGPAQVKRRIPTRR